MTAPHDLSPDFWPDFFVVGAAKAGTTAVYTWLKAHPQVFLPEVKEPGYFAHAGRSPTPAAGPHDPDYTRRITVTPEAYAALYRRAGQRLRGDVSPVYLTATGAAARIAALRPDARIIILLRDPVERAFSQFMHHSRDSLEPCRSFEAALEQEQARLERGWAWGFGYASQGFYAAQIAAYLRAFPKEQILFLDYRALQEAPEACWARICTHLGLGRRPLERNERVNATAGLARVSARPGLSHRLRHPGPVQALLKRAVPPRLRAGLRRVIEGGGRPVPVLRDETRQALAARYRAERPAIEALSGLCLAHWCG